MANPKPMLRPMEKIMLGMTAFFITGIIIFGFMPPNALRGIVMMVFVLAFTVFFMKPFGIDDKPRTQNRPPEPPQ